MKTSKLLTSHLAFMSLDDPLLLVSLWNSYFLVSRYFTPIGMHFQSLSCSTDRL